MTKDLTPHFSRKVLLVSFIFLLANLGIYGLKYVAGQPGMLRSVAPKLISATVGDIEVKTHYDEEYRAAQAGQEIFSGTYVRTGEAEFAELVLDDNIIRLDEQTEIRLIKNNFSGVSAYIPEKPRLEIELLSGSIWVDAFDLIQIEASRSVTRLNHSVAILTYSVPINRLMVVTGAADLNLLSSDKKLLSEFVVPLHNQVTFVDAQITDAYAALKPSKLKKELKMTPISTEVLEDEWVARNANDFEEKREAFSDGLINSSLAYRIRSGYQTALSYLTFIPEARRNLAIDKAKTMLAYVLGEVQESGDLTEAEKIIGQFSDLVTRRKNDPQLENLIVETLFAIEYSRSGRPTYLLKEFLIDKVAEREGTHVFAVYLTDIRRALFEGDVQAVEIVADKWLVHWRASLAENNIAEFDRQAQILNHTILSYISTITSPVLDVFDESGVMKMAYAKDAEEARYEVISDRLQITASLISSYRYILAKQYLKNSYLSLDIENLSPALASTQIFLANGKLLAQRIEYAEDVLHGAARPIDETKFRDYFQIIKRDEALSADLRKFFELDKEEIIVATEVEAPTAAQVAERFLDARINVNYADISLRPEGGFYYDVTNARLMDRGVGGESLSFDASYDFVSNSVTDVVTDERSYQGSFTLADIVTLLKTGGELKSKIPAPKVEEGIELLITDREKLEALEGQAIAQDVARQLAYNQLAVYGIVIPEVKFDIEILDALNLNHFHIKNALILRSDKEETIAVSFDYHSGTGEASNVTGEEGVVLLEKVPATELAEQVAEKTIELERELKVIGDFTGYVTQNELSIDPEDIVYTADGLLSLTDLELLTLELKVSGLYDPETEKFSSVFHNLLPSQDIGVKDYFELLADQYIISFMTENDFVLSAEQISADYPFKSISISQLNIEDYLFSFDLDIIGAKALEIARVGEDSTIDELTLEELKALPAQIQAEEAAKEAAEQAEVQETQED